MLLFPFELGLELPQHSQKRLAHDGAGRCRLLLAGLFLLLASTAARLVRLGEVIAVEVEAHENLVR